MEFRHFQTYRLPRGKRSDPPFSQAAVLDRKRLSSTRPPVVRRSRVLDSPALRGGGGVVASPLTTRRRGTLLVRRGRILWFDPTQVQIAPTWVPEIRHRTRPWFFFRRGRYLSFVPDQVVLTAPTWVPETRHRTRLILFLRRGRRVDPPWQVAAQPPPPWVPEPRRRGRNLPQPRRGHLFEPPKLQDSPIERRRPRLPTFRVVRGRTASPPWGQAVVVAPTWPPATIAQKRIRWARVRRGQRFWTVPAQERVPDRIPKRLRYGVIRKRGRGWGPNLVGAIFGPAPDWLEGGAASTGSESASYSTSGDGGSLSLGSEGSSSAGDFEGTSSEK